MTVSASLAALVTKTLLSRGSKAMPSVAPGGTGMLVSGDQL